MTQQPKQSSIGNPDTESGLMVNGKVLLKSVGCRTNQQEMTELAFCLAAKGYEITGETKTADIIILNSCSVTSCSESKTRRLVHSFANRAPTAKICVTGCLAQQRREEILSLPNVHWVVGNSHKSRIADILVSGECGVFISSVNDRAVMQSPEPVSSKVWQGRTRFPLKIQEGCDFRCSYCIVPSLRGPSRSARTESIENRFREAVAAGFKEIVITGTHIGQFEEKNASSLSDLLDRLTSLEGDFRIRLSSLDPRDITGRLLDQVAENPRICNHLHVSIQSFSPDILKAMDRPYRSVDSLVQRLGSLRREYVDVGIGGDFIVGFPGETERQFNQSCEAADMVGFTYGHVFRYSRRPGTPAAEMDNQVEASVKKERSEILRAQLHNQQKRFIEGLSGAPQTIIVEHDNPVRGVTSNYVRVEVPRMKAAGNSWQNIAFTGKQNSNGRWEAIPVGE
ncbi:MAG: tRNA (N(6)-L-threonylcarbamoyladenosine(37)-C(2))-methylthiotransferase MtaB [Chitinispirillaceae bacterium]